MASSHNAAHTPPAAAQYGVTTTARKGHSRQRPELTVFTGSLPNLGANAARHNNGDIRRPSTPPRNSRRQQLPISSRSKQVAAANRAAAAAGIREVQTLRAPSVPVRAHGRGRSAASLEATTTDEPTLFLDGMHGEEEDGERSDSREFEAVTPRQPPPLSQRFLGHQHQASDAHELKLPRENGARDSLVANMLLSLDQMDAGYGGNPTAATATNTQAATSTPTRPRTSKAQQHQHSRSYSSDYDAGDDMPPQRATPTRRKNSANRFGSSLDRIDSVYEPPYANGSRTGPVTPSAAARGTPATGQHNKHESSNSVATDYTEVADTERVAQWARETAQQDDTQQQSHTPARDQRRSQRQSAMANGKGGKSAAPPPIPRERASQPRLPRESIDQPSEATQEEDDYEAAPTPTVPGGPRRSLHPTPSMPSLPRPDTMANGESASKHQTLRKKKSARSTRSATVGKSAAPYMTEKDAPPVPSIEHPSSFEAAPAPHIGYEKQKDVEMLRTKDRKGSAQQQQQQQQQPQKERPGFLRRMFGSSKNVVAQERSAERVAMQREQQVNNAHADAWQVAAAGSTVSMGPQYHRTDSMTPSVDSRTMSHAQSQTDKAVQPPLQKKNSGFFRRRKRSVTDADQAQMPQIAPIKLPSTTAEHLRGDGAPFPSPVTSLRKAMDPYLSDAPPSSTTHGRQGSGASRKARGFSPEYELDMRATIRSVENHASKAEGLFTPPPDMVPSMELPTRPPPAVPGGVVKDEKTDGDRSSEDIPARDFKLAPEYPVQGEEAEEAEEAEETEEAQEAQEVGDEEGDTTLKPVKTNKTGEDPMPAGQKMAVAVAAAAAAGLPSVKVDHHDEGDTDGLDPTDEDRSRAQDIFNDDEEFIVRDKAATWMGGDGVMRQRTLHAYMQLYTFTGRNVVSGLRELCNRLILRAETQQVDRILLAFAKRWVECNPNNGFKGVDVIHTLCYSIILLNTDLHVADIEQKMTKSQFVKNTMTTVQHALEDHPDAFQRPSILPRQSSGLDPDSQTSVDHPRSTTRHSMIRSGRAGSSLGDNAADADEAGPLVEGPFEGTLRAWEAQMETVLKNTYQSIRDVKLPLYGADVNADYPSGSLGVSRMRRTPSVLSRTPSESISAAPSNANNTPSFSRGRGPGSDRFSRWTSKSRSRAGNRPGIASSRTSFDDGQSSIWSPMESSATWGSHAGSLGRTQTSFSVDSFRSHANGGRMDYHQSIGFANALSQAITRQDPMGSMPSLLTQDNDRSGTNGASGGYSSNSTVKPPPGPLLEDESLELAGAPWVKEGMVVHKHHLADGVDKKSKDRAWTEVFAVVQKGSMSMFRFTPTKSFGRSTFRPGSSASRFSTHAGAFSSKKAVNGIVNPVVGGGNWQDSATQLGRWDLRQTLASALPPPGYSKARPHVWALSLPTGAVHLFSVGTADIVKEFVSTVNYWSARLTTHPLVGGISNIEYGWGEAIVRNALVEAVESATAEGNTLPGGAVLQGIGPGKNTDTSKTHSPRASTSTSRMGSVSTTATLPSSPLASTSLRLPADQIHISAWHPPSTTLRPSPLSESDQLSSLTSYVATLESDLATHNALRSPMLLAFSPKGRENANKAMGNWERKSSYLLREIVKFRTYAEGLRAAGRRRDEVWEERRRLEDGDEGDEGDERDEAVEVDTGEAGFDPDATLRA